MKKLLFSLNLILLFHFFTINFAYCEEDFFMNSNFKEAKKQSKISQTAKEKTGFFSKFKKDKKTDDSEISKGYYGALPNISRDFAYKKQVADTTSEIDAKIPTKEELDNENLKSAPFDDALFLDVIVKKEK